MAQFRVAEQFVSLNGEGVFAGQLAVFIRFQGCNLNCSYCDTAWANQAETPYVLMSEKQIYELVKETGIQNVTVTGGEPLLQEHIITLLKLFGEDKDLRVEIETNGSIDLHTFLHMSHSPAFTMDYKLPGSLMESKMCLSNFHILRKKDTVKFVAGSFQDLERAREIIMAYHLVGKCHVYLSTVFGKIRLSDAAEYIKRHKMNGVTLQLQMHKIIWGPDVQGV